MSLILICLFIVHQHFIKYFSNPEFPSNETKFVRHIYRIEPEAKYIAQLMNIFMELIHVEAFSGNWPTFNFINHPYKVMAKICNIMCQDLLNKKEFLRQLRKENFDIGITEMYDICSMGIFHAIGVRTKLVASAVPLFPLIGRRFGMPTFPSFMPNIISNIQPLESSFFARFVNFINVFYDWAWMDDRTVQFQDPLFQHEFGPEFPKLKEIARNAALIFVNSNPFFEMPTPISNKIIYIGGLVDKIGDKEEYLDKRSQHILDNAKEGAVLFTFGSAAETAGMKPEMRRAILKALAQFPQIQFIWKLDNASRDADSELFAAIPNVHIFEWIHQSALLKHPNLRLFISHCGQNSLTEAIRAGIPVLGIPLLGDQLYNLIVAKSHGVADYVDVRELNGPNAEQFLANALENILNDPKYAEKAKQIQKKVTQTPFSPAEKLIRWVEFAAEFPDLNELNLPVDEEMNWFIYYSLDAITFTLTILIGLIWIGWKCTKLLLNIFNNFIKEGRNVRRLAKEVKK